MIKRIMFFTAALAMLFILASCKSIDVVGSMSITSFFEILGALPERVTADEMNGGWSLSAPDDSGARFIWSKDWSASPIHDVMLEIDAQPFIDAGLDVNKLPDGLYFDGKIMVGTKLGTESLTYKGDATPLSSYEQIVNLKRESINYHTKLDHYGVMLGDGNMFEWAKDMSTNDKDIVFVLNPQLFIDAGVDPEAVEGWVFAKVPVEDENGKPIEVDKLLKPFNIE